MAPSEECILRGICRDISINSDLIAVPIHTVHHCKCTISTIISLISSHFCPCIYCIVSAAPRFLRNNQNIWKSHTVLSSLSLNPTYPPFNPSSVCHYCVKVDIMQKSNTTNLIKYDPLYQCYTLISSSFFSVYSISWNYICSLLLFYLGDECFKNIMIVSYSNQAMCVQLCHWESFT